MVPRNVACVVVRVIRECKVLDNLIINVEAVEVLVFVKYVDFGSSKVSQLALLPQDRVKATKYQVNKMSYIISL